MQGDEIASHVTSFLRHTNRTTAVAFFPKSFFCFLFALVSFLAAASPCMEHIDRHEEVK